MTLNLTKPRPKLARARTLFALAARKTDMGDRADKEISNGEYLAGISARPVSYLNVVPFAARKNRRSLFSSTYLYMFADYQDVLETRP